MLKPESIPAIQNEENPDVNTVFQFLLKRNRILLQQLMVSKTESVHSNQFVVVPVIDKSIEPFTTREISSRAWLKTFIGIAVINKLSFVYTPFPIIKRIRKNQVIYG